MSTKRTFKAPAFWYRILFPISFLFWLFHAIHHAAKFKQWRYIAHRLGFSPKPPANSIWLHASSIGEVNLIRPLCEQLIAQNHCITITTFTASGLQRANDLFSTQVNVMALPMDCWPISFIFAQRLQAKCGLIAETELWPECLYQVAKSNTPLLHINARLSAKSLNTPKLIKHLLTTTLSYFEQHLTRYDSDALNFNAMGVAENKIQIMGNLKYAQAQHTQTPNNIIKQPYLLLASSHDNEEQLFCSLVRDNTWPLLVIVPRHPQRLQSILHALHSTNIKKESIAVRSLNQPINNLTKIYIVDTFGELNPLFQHAQLVIMGGSFVDIGGHNLLEPAALGACIITGPSDSNIKHDISDLKQCSAITQVSSIDALKPVIKTLLNDDETRQLQGKNAARFVANAQQVLERYMSAIQHYLD